MKIKKIFILIFFIFISLIVYSQRSNLLYNVLAAVDTNEDDSYLGLVEKGWNITCLASSPTADFDTNHVPGNHTVQINLKGQCQAAEGCYLVVCQGPNEQYYEDQARLEECQRHDPNEELPAANSWEGERTWGAWCAHVEEQIGDTFESVQGCKSGVAEVDAILPNSSDQTIPTAIVPNMADQYHFANGSIETTITLNGAYDHIPYQFYAFGQGGTITELGTGAEGNDRSQQLGQINTFELGAEGNVGKCVTITWDPYGRVFDSQSLEPISNIQVNLLDELKKPVKQITKNYDITSTNGVFNIQVEKQGNYYMAVNPPVTHEFIANPKLNPNYKYIYSDIYYPDQMFFEKVGVPTHHDIPLNPKGTPYHSDIIIYEQSLNQMDLGNSVKFEGKVSHPLANICLQGEITKKNYVCNQADKIGQFQIFINKKNYPQEALIIKASKVDPNNIAQFIQLSVRVESLLTPVPGKTLSKEFRFEPLLRHLEGYVYDNQGQIASKAQVNIRLKQDKKLIHKTISDDKGYIKITSENLPLFDYYIEVVPSQSSKPMVVTTSNFINNNEDFIKSEKLNLMTVTKDDKPMYKTSFNQSDKLNQVDQNKVKNQPTIPVKSFFNKNLIIIGLILFLLITVTVGMVLYIKKSKSV
jgi:hypothetical protein